MAYASTLFRPSPDENVDAARRYVDLGFRGVKFGWGGFGIDSGRDRENLAAVRGVLGVETALMVDPGWYVEDGSGVRVRTRAQTTAMLTVLQDVEPYWVEDFVHPDELRSYRELKAEFPALRFAAGEQQATRAEFEQLAEFGVDVLQPDLSRCGGLTVARGLPAAAGTCEIVTHSWLTDLLLAYSLHYLATLPSATWVEFNVAQSELSGGVAASKICLESDGTVAVPGGVGLGVVVDEEFVESRQIVEGTP
jgi:L-alanine-DL-glutamate epimerase-like enolase superfamily enzyme